jgi:hypothetical protein
MRELRFFPFALFTQGVNILLKEDQQKQSMKQQSRRKRNQIRSLPPNHLETCSSVGSS